MTQMNLWCLGMLAVTVLFIGLGLSGAITLSAKGTTAMLLSPFALIIFGVILRSFYQDFRTIDIEKGKAVLGYLWPCPAQTLETSRIKSFRVKNEGRSEAIWVFSIVTADDKRYKSVAKGDSEAKDVKMMVQAAARLSQETGIGFDCAAGDEGGLKVEGACQAASP